MNPTHDDVANASTPLSVPPDPAPRRRHRVLFAYAGPTGSPPGWISGHRLLKGCVDWLNVAVGARSTLARIVAGMLLFHELGAVEVVVSMDYFTAIGVNLRLRLTGSKTRHLVWGLNQSRRLITQGLAGRFVTWLFGRTDMVVTHSSEETAIFSRLHAIPTERFRFVRWGFDLPAITPTPLFSGRSEPYVCLIGRNNRDIRTFVEGMQGTGLRGVVISNKLSPAEQAEYERAGIELHADLDFNSCLDCIRNAFASAVLLNDSNRGAGHITIVAAMYLGVPQIVTDSSVVREYFVAGEHGLSVELGHADAFRAAVLALRADPLATERMREASVRDAPTMFSNDTVAIEFMRLLSELEAQPGLAPR